MRVHSYTTSLANPSTHLKPKRHQLEHTLYGEGRREDEIQHVQGLGVLVRLVVEAHGERDGVAEDEDEDEVLEGLGGDEPPYPVLEPVFGDVAPHRAGLQRKLDTVPLQIGEGGQRGREKTSA